MKKPYEIPESEELQLGPYEDVCQGPSNPDSKPYIIGPESPNESVGDGGSLGW